MSSTAKPPLLALPSRISRYGVRASMATCADIHTGRGLFSPLAVSDHNCNNKMKNLEQKSTRYTVPFKKMLNLAFCINKKGKNFVFYQKAQRI